MFISSLGYIKRVSLSQIFDFHFWSENIGHPMLAPNGIFCTILLYIVPRQWYSVHILWISLYAKYQYFTFYELSKFATRFVSHLKTFLELRLFLWIYFASWTCYYSCITDFGILQWVELGGPGQTHTSSTFCKTEILDIVGFHHGFVSLSC